MAAPLYTTDSGLLWHAGKILVVTVGLPARGKTHISRALERYLRWTGVKTTVISLGDYRRKIAGGAQKLPKDYFTLGERTTETAELRKKVLLGCEQTIWEYFEGGGQVVIYDANNGTREARNTLAEKFDKQGIHVIMLESVCDDSEVIERNIRSVKISSPDYRGWDAEKAVEDYYTRIRDHEKYYEPVEETTWPSIRIINVSEQVLVNNIRGYLQTRIVFFLMNIHNKPRTIYFARSGQSLIEHSYKADSDLSPAGWEYAERLKDFVLDRRAKTFEARGQDHREHRLVIWTSARRRSHHTAWPFIAASTQVGSTFMPASHSISGTLSRLAPSISAGSGTDDPAAFSTSPADYAPPLGIPAYAPHPDDPDEPIKSGTPTPAQGGAAGANANMGIRVKVVEKAQMGEINPGVWDGLNPDQARKYYPDEWEKFANDPYAYRAPRAESYHDLCVRLEPILIELEREQEDLLIISHASVIRCLLAYLIGLPGPQVPAIEVARGDLIEVVPTSYGVRCQTYHFWDGPGRRDPNGPANMGGKDETNFYENYAEDTKGKKVTVDGATPAS